MGNITLISATSPGQTAVEVQLGKQSAGLFTLALTQSLWENSSTSVMASLWDHSRNLLVPRLGTEQIPQWRSPNNSPDFLAPTTLTTGGEGMVTGLISGNSLQSQIVALAPLVQKRALVHSCYLTFPATETGSDLNSTDNSLWQVQSVKGQSATLTAITKTSSTKAESATSSTEANGGESKKEMLVGSALREIYRAIPKNLALTVALAHDLERIERVDATSAFGAIAAVETVINAGEGSADCVFGRLEAHRYSLFTEGETLCNP
ncbi:caspase family protein [Synechocystis sp. B12]|nr:caspase family protein [Synechocystis sp. B12]